MPKRATNLSDPGVEVTLTQVTRRHMATDFDFVISSPQQQSPLAHTILFQAHERVAEMERELSEFLDSSPIYRLNHVRTGQPVCLGKHGIALLESCRRLWSVTEGAFDPTAKGKPNFEAITWDAQKNVVWRQSEVHLGFGAIGKGYALDAVRSYLELHGFRNYCLSAGGSSIVLSGFMGPSDPWSWAWSWQRDSLGNNLGIEFTHESGESVAIGVSGLHEKGDHLVDPNGKRKAQGLKSALIAQRDATDADALSTALFVMGWEKAHKHFESVEPQPAMAIIDTEGVVRCNGTFNQFSGQWGSALSVAVVQLLLSGLAFADEEIDLGDLGFDDFTPYIFDRDPWWLLAPLLMIFAVLIHMKKVKKPEPMVNEEGGDKDESDQSVDYGSDVISLDRKQ